MAYTFGAATTDAITHTLSTSLIGSGRSAFVSLWVFPTTLTATRKLWGQTGSPGIEIDSTTTNLRMRTDNTTDGQWTAPAGLAVNTWTFVAALFDSNTTTGHAWAIWTGTPTTPPVRQTVTVATAASGNIVTPTGTVAVGNAISGSLAFQGDIGGFIAIADPGAAGANVLGQLKNGTISNVDAVYRAFVEPAWRGDVAAIGGYGRLKFATAATSGVQAINPMDFNATYMRPQVGYTTATVSGATVSARRTPRPFQTTYDQHVVRGKRNGYVGLA